MGPLNSQHMESPKISAIMDEFWENFVETFFDYYSYIISLVWVIKGEMEVARRRGRRRKKLLDDLKDRREYSHLKEEALDRTIWRHRFVGGFGPVVRQNTEWMSELQREMRADKDVDLV